jgi:hypothetical protein
LCFGNAAVLAGRNRGINPYHLEAVELRGELHSKMPKLIEESPQFASADAGAAEDVSRAQTLARAGRFAALWRSPGLAVAAAFLLRILFLWLTHRGEDFNHPKFPTIGVETGNVAWTIASGRGFSTPWYGFEGPTAWLAPVYPYLLALVCKLVHMQKPAALIASQTLNCVFAAATCWPIYGIGKKVFSPNIGLASAWLWVILPTAIQMPLEWIWDQSLTALLLALLLYMTLGLRENSSPQHWTGYGLLWAVSALTNPALCVLLPFLLGWVALERRKRDLPWGRLAARTAAFFVVSLLPWTARNYWAMDGFVPIKSNFGLELWLGNNPGVQHIYTPELHPWLNLNQELALIMSGEVNYSHVKQRLAVDYIKAHPGVFLKRSFERFVDTWTANYDSRTDPWLVAVGVREKYVIFTTAFALFTLVGLLAAGRDVGAASAPLILSLLVFPIIYYITHSAARYRHPVDPVMCILSVYAVSYLWTAVSSRFKGSKEAFTASSTRRFVIPS